MARKLKPRITHTCIIVVCLFLCLTRGHAFVSPGSFSLRRLRRETFVLVDESSTSSTNLHSSAPGVLSDWQRFFKPFIQFTLHSFLLAILFISWEDLTCSYAIPSRQRTSLLSTAQTSTEQSSSVSLSSHSTWGQSTVRGMGFGLQERLQLIQDDDDDDDAEETANLRSYNEIMLQHRETRIPQWRVAEAPTTSTQQAQAIHGLLECYQSLESLRQYATDYQWTSLHAALRQDPWTTKLQSAANYLRSVDQAVGFDWASCAWRHCGALADIQEAVDELDALGGVLEPFEALFCLDIVERAVRDMLAEAPWAVASPEDQMLYASLPPYQAHRVFDPPNDPSNPEISLESDESWRLDEEYLRALQSLRIDDDDDEK